MHGCRIFHSIRWIRVFDGTYRRKVNRGGAKMNADIMMYRGTLKKEKIQQVREDIINILAEHDLNYGEARIILENFESFLEEQTRILKVSSK